MNLTKVPLFAQFLKGVVSPEAGNAECDQREDSEKDSGPVGNAVLVDPIGAPFYSPHFWHLHCLGFGPPQIQSVSI